MAKKLSSLIFVVCILFTGCTIDYDEESGEIVKSEEIPDSILQNFELIKIKKNSVSSKVTSSKTEIYNSKDKTVMYDVKFLEYDTHDGSVTTKGDVKKVEYFNDTEDAQLSGEIIFYSEKEGMELTGETLFWNSELKTIESEDNIKVIKEDGSEIEGDGFSANIKNSTFSFSSNIKGINP